MTPDEIQEAFEQSRFYYAGESPADRIANKMVWTEAFEAGMKAVAPTPPVMWLEAEENMRGKTIEELLTPPLSMMYSSRWHYGPERPKTNNPVWPLYGAPAPSLKG
jgi:hypothetical protein